MSNEILDVLNKNSVEFNSTEDFIDIIKTITKSLKNTKGVGSKTIENFIEGFENEIKEIKYKQETNRSNELISKALGENLSDKTENEANKFIKLLYGISGSNIVIKIDSTSQLNLIINFIIKLCEINDVELRFEFNTPYDNDLVEVSSKKGDEFLWFEISEGKIYCYYDLTGIDIVDENEFNRDNIIIGEKFIELLKTHSGIDNFKNDEQPRDYVRSEG